MVIMKPYLTAFIKMTGETHEYHTNVSCSRLQRKPHICARLLRLPWDLLSDSIDKESARCQLPNPQDKITDKQQRIPRRAASIIYSKITDDGARQSVGGLKPGADGLAEQVAEDTEQPGA